MIQFDSPNLDNQPVGDLRQVADVLQLLADYAAAKAQAMDNRLAGHITTAVKIENHCDRLYRTLPRWARW